MKYIIDAKKLKIQPDRECYYISAEDLESSPSLSGREVKFLEDKRLDVSSHLVQYLAIIKKLWGG